jgi:hypothetical protein
MDIQGSAEVLRNIKNAITIVSESTQEAFVEVGERGVGYLKRETPVDTGRLRNSMSYTISNKVYTPLGNNKDNVNKSSDKDTLYIGTNVIYAPSVEYLAKNGSAGFMLRAYNQTKKVADQIFQKVIGRAVK